MIIQIIHTLAGIGICFSVGVIIGMVLAWVKLQQKNR